MLSTRFASLVLSALVVVACGGEGAPESSSPIADDCGPWLVACNADFLADCEVDVCGAFLAGTDAAGEIFWIQRKAKAFPCDGADCDEARREACGLAEPTPRPCPTPTDPPLATQIESE